MPELPPFVKSLLKPGGYPQPPQKIELKQTQMSFVFLADDLVYKAKKPVDLGYLDYTTLEKRRHFCQRELELNRRLCPDVYLEVVPITNDNGRISIGGSGETIEYAVKMRRLPDGRMMDVLLAKDRVTPDMLEGLAERLARFHREAETNGQIASFGGLETVRRNNDENFSQTEKYVGKAIPAARYTELEDFTKNFIERHRALFEKRVKDGRIRDLHGDLHAAHICFTNGVCVYDCIEFNDRFRYGDVASEMAFLAMDLDHYGRADLSRLFINSYIAESGDDELRQLLPFYKSYRACVRGKVTCFKLDDPYVSDEEKRRILTEATDYFQLAQSYVKQKPTLFITAGLVGCGKSSFSQALAARLGLVVISSDVTRKRLAGIPLMEHRYEDFDRGIYSPGFGLKTYAAMFEEAAAILDEGYPVILDASFIKSDIRQEAVKLAGKTGADFLAIECSLEENKVKERLQHRSKEASLSDGRWEIYPRQKTEFEPLLDIAPPNYVIIDTSEPVEANIEKVIDRVGQL